MHPFCFLLGALTFLFSLSCAAATSSGQYEVVERLRTVPDGWIQGSPASPSMLMQFRLAIRQERAAEFEQIAINIATPGHGLYGKHMKRDEIKAFLRPSSDVSDAILSWLKSEEVSDDLIEDDGDWVKFTVPVKQAERILKTRFYYFHHKTNGMYKIRTLEYSVPRIIRPYIQLIQPTTRFGEVKPQKSFVLEQKQVSDAGNVDTDCNSIVTPACLRGLYKLGDFKASPDSRNKLGISGYLDQYARYADLESFLETYAPSMANANFTVQSIDGGLNEQSSSEDSVEASLDIQYAISLSYQVPTVFYTTGGRGPLVADLSEPNADDSSNEPYLEQLHYLVGLPDEQLPSVLSTSYGENEQTVPESYSNATCSLFAQLGTRGVSVIFSSGDEGVGGTCMTNDGTNTTRFNPVYPASCPFVTSVGGTYQTNPERAIYFSSGGFSERFPRPSYQEQAVSTYLSKLGIQWEGLYNRSGRGFPDVAAQSHNYAVIDHGGFVRVDGTRFVLDIFIFGNLY
jgi:tripeptidyl-peptidase-1